MTREQSQVREFHRVFGAMINDKPTAVSFADAALRLNLIKEEWNELSAASFSQDITEVADALGDLLYVLLGTAVTYGIDLEPVFAEVHRSNMTKLWTNEEIEECLPPDVTVTAVRDVHLHERTTRAFVVKRADGKVIKSPTYEPAQIGSVINANH